jgi:hypothetical protein
MTRELEAEGKGKSELLSLEGGGSGNPVRFSPTDLSR